MPSPTAEASRGSVATLLPGWQVLVIDDLGLTYAVPPGWAEVEVHELRAQLDESITSGSVNGQIADAWAWLRDQIDEGVLVAGATGRSTLAGYTDSVLFFVRASPPDLRTGVATALDESPALGNDPVVDPQVLSIPMGDALVARVKTEPEGGAPSQSVNWFTLLPDGRLLWLNSAAPAGEESFEDVIAIVAGSLRLR
jgi:hypothetical protein